MEENKFFKEVKEWSKALLLALVAAIFINVFIFENQQVKGSSMLPTFHEDERVMVWKLSHFAHVEPNYGDVVIIDSRVERVRTLKDEFIDQALISKILHQQNENFWIKRVIGKEGDILEFKEGKVYRNGEALEEDYINEPMNDEGEAITVPKNHVFVMGDNRNHSSDSRFIGPVPIENIRGTVLFRFWPLDSMKTF